MIAAKNVHKTIGKHMLADGLNPVIDLEKSHGSWLVDARSGKEYLDLFSMFASMPVGYNHPYLKKNSNRLTRTAMNKITNSDIYSREMADFVDTVGEIAQPDYLPYAFYVEGGTLAVENALKVAFDWKVRKNMAAGKKKMGSKVIHFNDCFHGRSGYTMSMTDSPDPRKTLYFPKFDWPRITNPKITFPMDEVAVAKAEAKSVAEIKKAIKSNRDEIAALIIEPIQCEGGDNHFRKEFFAQLRQLCDENEMMLIYDEVQTGVGITGKMWAHQHFGKSCRPDIISFGKKTQICGIFVSKRVDEVEKNVFHESSRLNSTWGGNIVDMVRFTLYLDVIKKEQLVEKAAVNGKYLLKKLYQLQKDFSQIVSNARGRGLLCAIDLSSTETRNKAIDLIEKEGALILGCGKRSIRFRPHLNIKPEEIDLGLEIINRALKKL